MSGILENLAGKRFGQVRVKERAPNRKRSTMWVVECACGKQWAAAASALKTGRVKRCLACKAEHHRKIVKAWRYKGATLWQIAERMGVKADTLAQRCRRGWSPRRAATTRVRDYRRVD